MDERRMTEFLVVRDYVELQNKKRVYIEKKVLGGQEVVLPKRILEGMKKAEEKANVKEKIRFERNIGELYVNRKRIPKGLYLPKPSIDDEENKLSEEEEDKEDEEGAEYDSNEERLTKN